MEITVDIGYEQLLTAIKKLPAAKMKQLKSALDNSMIEEKVAKEFTDLQNFLLSAPVMTDKQYEDHLFGRKHFNAWRTK